jgi:rSAM/selenodomain-associated transferase 2
VKVSVIIPTLDEEASLPAALRSAREAGAGEVIVADGGSRDRTAEIGRRMADVVIECPKGRAAQMNAGAAASSGDILIFLHADTVLPAGAVDSVRDAVAGGGFVGGAFSVKLSVSRSASAYGNAVLSLVGKMIGVRSKLFRSYTGDQGMFVRKDAFEALGGFPIIPLMEDVELSRSLSGRGKTILLPARITTSGRRWEARGPARTILLMWGLRLAYSLGMSPARCARIYAGKAPTPRL